MKHSIPAPLPLRPRSSPVPVARSSVGSSALEIAPRYALIVDDCRFVAERLAQMLEAKGFTCTLAADGVIALEILREHPFELVVLDTNAPVLDGFSVLRQLRKDPARLNTPVLMLNADTSSTEHDRAIALGASAYMNKPLQLRSFDAMIDSLIDPVPSQ